MSRAWRVRNGEWTPIDDPFWDGIETVDDEQERKRWNEFGYESCATGKGENEGGRMRVNIVGFKGVTLSQQLPKKVFVCGKNGSGKSAILDGVRWAITGTVPTGKSREEIDLYCSPEKQACVAKLFNDSGEDHLACSILTRDGESVRTKHEASARFNESLLSPKDLVTMSPWKRVEWFYEALGMDFAQVPDAEVDAVLVSKDIPLHEYEEVHEFLTGAATDFEGVKKAVASLREQHRTDTAVLMALPMGDAKSALAYSYQLADKLKRVPDDAVLEEYLRCVAVVLRDKRAAHYESLTMTLQCMRHIEGAMRTVYAKRLVDHVASISADASIMAGKPVLIRAIDDGVRIWYDGKALESVSAGEAVLCLTAICNACVSGDGRLNVLLIEADPCDDKNILWLIAMVQMQNYDLCMVATCRTLTNDHIASLAMKDWAVVMLD